MDQNALPVVIIGHFNTSPGRRARRAPSGNLTIHLSRLLHSSTSTPTCTSWRAPPSQTHTCDCRPPSRQHWERRGHAPSVRRHGGRAGHACARWFRPAAIDGIPRRPPRHRAPFKHHPSSREPPRRRLYARPKHLRESLLRRGAGDTQELRTARRASEESMSGGDRNGSMTDRERQRPVARMDTWESSGPSVA